MVFGHGHELVAVPRGGFRCAKHEIAVGGEPRSKAGEDRALSGFVEIDEHIPAEDHVEHPERLAIAEEIMRPELDLAADVGTDLPRVSDLVEIFDQERDRQAPLHLELTVEPLARLAERILDEIRGHDLDRPANQPAVPLGKLHAKRIGFLPGRRRRAPDPDAALSLPLRHKLRQHYVDEIMERHFVAEKMGLLYRHGLSNAGAQMMSVRLHHGEHEMRQGGKRELPQQRPELAFEHILLVLAEIEAGVLPQDSAHQAALMRLHRRSPLISFATVWAIPTGGRTAAQAPTEAAAPGMPHTTLEASSWAITLPPASAMARAPAAPSWPMPVSTTPSAAGPNVEATLANKGSTAGRQKWTGGSFPMRKAG